MTLTYLDVGVVIGTGIGRDIGACIDINDRIKSPEINSCVYEQLILYKSIKIIQ